MENGPKRLLFVDDERGIRETLAAILRRYTFQVTLAASVSQALDAMAKQEFDILLCDLNLEREGDGFDVIRAMRQFNANCVILILTGHPAIGTVIEAMQLGIDDYITKPASADTLVAMLANKLSSHKRFSPPAVLQKENPVS